MDIATAIGIGKKVAKVADKVIKYVKDDNSHFYGLDDDVTAVVTGEGVSPWAEGGGDPEVIPGCGSVTTADGTLSVEATGPGRVILVAHPFDASLEVWNGPDILPDTTYRWMLASLFHDLIWAHRKELAAKAVENDGWSSNEEFTEGQTYYTLISGYDGSFKQTTIYKFKWSGDSCNLYFHDTDSANIVLYFNE